MNELLEQVKTNLQITFADDDKLIESVIETAPFYATKYQHLPEGHYGTNQMSAAIRQGVVMLASHFYEFRDGSTGGFQADKTDADRAVWDAVNALLRLDREWEI